MTEKSTNSKYTLSERKLFLRIFDILFVAFGLMLAINFGELEYFDISNPRLYIHLITLSIYFVLIGQVFELYNLEISSDYYSIIRSVVGTCTTVTLLYVFTPYVAPVLPEKRLMIVYFFGSLVIPLLFWRMIYIIFVFSPKYFSTVMLVGTKQEIRDMLKFINEKAPTHQIVACISDDKVYHKGMKHYRFEKNALNTIVEEHSISEVIVGEFDVDTHESVHNELIHLFEKGISIVSRKSFEKREAALMPAFKTHEAFYDEITLSKNHHNRVYLFLMRVIDVFVSTVGLMFMLLILPFIWIGNLIANRGSLFYSQDRVGENGTVFEIIKFRTMVENAEKNGAQWAKVNDKRVTPFGKFMRKTRLDEVPQFFNIIKGEMTLIGPRPERPELVKKLEKKLPFYVIRHIVRPGLTGWAQVMYPYASGVKDQEMKLRYDFYYIKKRSLILDFKILVKTVTTVLFFRGQ